MPTQAERIYEKFGGVSNLRAALKAVRPEKPWSRSGLYKWNLSRKDHPAHGLIPSSVWPDLIQAARLTGVVLTPEDMDPTGTVMPRLPPLDLPPLTIVVSEAGYSRIEVAAMYRCFPRYALDSGWRLLGDVIAQQQRVIEPIVTMEAFADDDDSAKIVEGLRSKLDLWRRSVAIGKVVTAAALVRSEMSEHPEMKFVLAAAQREVVSELGRALEKDGVVRLYDGTPQARRTVILERFSSDPSCRVLVGQVAALQMAPLTHVSELLFADAEWAPTANVAAIKALHRPGQTRAVRVRFLRAERRLDGPVQRLLCNQARKMTGGRPA